MAQQKKNQKKTNEREKKEKNRWEPKQIRTEKRDGLAKNEKKKKKSELSLLFTNGTRRMESGEHGKNKSGI